MRENNYILIRSVYILYRFDILKCDISIGGGGGNV